MSNKKAYETAARANDGYVTKDAPLILFRGALDHCQAEIIVTQAMLDQEILFARSIDPAIEASLTAPAARSVSSASRWTNSRSTPTTPRNTTASRP